MDNQKRCFRLWREAGNFRLVSISTFFFVFVLFFFWMAMKGTVLSVTGFEVSVHNLMLLIFKSYIILLPLWVRHYP